MRHVLYTHECAWLCFILGCGETIVAGTPLGASRSSSDNEVGVRSESGDAALMDRVAPNGDDPHVVMVMMMSG